MDLYAMRRANGDWFALENNGRLRVPVFQSAHGALMARLRNLGMLLFEPVALDLQLLQELAPAGAPSNVDFCIVKDPFANLSRIALITHAKLVLLIGDLAKRPSLLRNENGGQTFGPLPAQVLKAASAASG